MAIYKTARFTVKAESLAKCQQAIREFVDYVEQNESKTLLYIAMQERDRPTTFLHYFIFEDAAAEERHSSSEAVRRFTGILYPECVTPVEFTDYVPLASTDPRDS